MIMKKTNRFILIQNSHKKFGKISGRSVQSKVSARNEMSMRSIINMRFAGTKKNLSNVRNHVFRVRPNLMPNSPQIRKGLSKNHTNRWRRHEKFKINETSQMHWNRRKFQNTWKHQKNSIRDRSNWNSADMGGMEEKFFWNGRMGQNRPIWCVLAK